MKPALNKTVIIILGPTGVGKTGFSLLLAKALKTEIISADSMQVYRHMDIGTAKPSEDELKTVPHHLINILSPDETFSAGLFREKAVKAVNYLHSKNMIPLIVGGTGLYIRSLTRGLFDGPSADWALRKKMIAEEDRLGKGHLYKRLLRIDPDAAKKIGPNDMRRIIRALEVSLKEEKRFSESQRGSTNPSDYNFIKIGLSRERKELYRLIEERVDKMMEEGLLEETKKILKLRPNTTALQALGYKEIALYLDRKLDLNEAVRLTKKRTKMFAKRQFTWFKKEPDINWVDITGITDADKVFAKVINDVKILKKHLPVT
jgi:tRNA dimethylallyltransferase